MTCSCVGVCCHQDVTGRQKGFFLLLPGGKHKPAVRQACPGLWLWNAGEPASPETCPQWPVWRTAGPAPRAGRHTRSFVQGASRHPSRGLDGSRATELIPQTPEFPSGQKRWWLRGWRCRRAEPGFSTCSFEEVVLLWGCSRPGPWTSSASRVGRRRGHTSVARPRLA